MMTGSTEKGQLALVLHGHLPFVRHPEHDRFLEEDWLYEAITETYIPLLNVFDGLVRDGIDFRLTMSLSPTLLSMLADPLLQQRYIRHMNRLIELARAELMRTKNDSAMNALAQMYLGIFENAYDTFERKYERNLIAAFRSLQDVGRLELITCAATHGFLPLMQNTAAVRAQVCVAVEHYRRIFGKCPRGIWLPECGYYPGLDEVLHEAGLRYFITDSHGILHATPRPKYGVYAPLYCRSGVAAFGRDMESSKQVWSSIEGYPGDYDYRDFYRDVGFDLDAEYLRPFLHPDGIRTHLGIKYYRITGKTDQKELYNPGWASDKAERHAENFLMNRARQLERLSGLIPDRVPIILAPYDAELFGHWWFEGPKWLDMLIRKTARDQAALRLVTPSEYLRDNPECQVATPAFSSWGQNGYAEVWLNDANDWIYPHLHKAADRMSELADRYPNAVGLRKRALNQACRELLLAQSSDWAFIMKTGSHVEYAVKRTKEHILRFTRLYNEIVGNCIDESALEEIEGMEPIFPDLDYRVYARRQ